MGAPACSTIVRYSSVVCVRIGRWQHYPQSPSTQCRRQRRRSTSSSPRRRSRIIQGFATISLAVLLLCPTFFAAITPKERRILMLIQPSIHPPIHRSLCSSSSPTFGIAASPDIPHCNLLHWWLVSSDDLNAMLCGRMDHRIVYITLLFAILNSSLVVLVMVLSLPADTATGTHRELLRCHSFIPFPDLLLLLLLLLRANWDVVAQSQLCSSLM